MTYFRLASCSNVLDSSRHMGVQRIYPISWHFVYVSSHFYNFLHWNRERWCQHPHKFMNEGRNYPLFLGSSSTGLTEYLIHENKNRRDKLNSMNFIFRFPSLSKVLSVKVCRFLLKCGHFNRPSFILNLGGNEQKETFEIFGEGD